MVKRDFVGAKEERREERVSLFTLFTLFTIPLTRKKKESTLTLTRKKKKSTLCHSLPVPLPIPFSHR